MEQASLVVIIFAETLARKFSIRRRFILMSVVLRVHGIVFSISDTGYYSYCSIISYIELSKHYALLITFMATQWVTTWHGWRRITIPTLLSVSCAIARLVLSQTLKSCINNFCELCEKKQIILSHVNFTTLKLTHKIRWKNFDTYSSPMKSVFGICSHRGSLVCPACTLFEVESNSAAKWNLKNIIK